MPTRCRAPSAALLVSALAAWWIPLGPVAAVQLVTATVVHVADGDTFSVVLTEGRRVRIDLSRIDAPELDQPHGRAARRALAELVFNRRVQLQVAGNSSGPLLSDAWVDGVDVSLRMLAGGHAWLLPSWSGTHELATAQNRARVLARGLWRSAVRVPPWQWRIGASAPAS